MHDPKFFFFNDTATTEIYTLSLHDALPISRYETTAAVTPTTRVRPHDLPEHRVDRKSTRLNSSHTVISYAVFCLKKKNTRHRCCARSTSRCTVPGRPSRRRPWPSRSPSGRP